MSFCEGPSAGTGSTILGMVSLSGMFEIKPLSATDQLATRLGQDSSSCYASVSSSVQWGGKYYTHLVGPWLNCSGWRVLGIDNICQNFPNSCPYLSCGRETEAHSGEMMGPWLPSWHTVWLGSEPRTIKLTEL